MQCPNQSYTQLILLALLLALSSCNKNAPQANNDQASVRQPSIDFGELQRLYDYDRDAPLDLKEHLSEDKNGLKTLDVSYLSPKGGRVPAYLIVPPGKGLFAGVIFMHPAGRDIGRSYFLDEAIELSKRGVVSILIDAPFARPSAQPLLTFTEQDREGFIQGVVDLRRAVDALLARGDVDDGRIGYVGFSYGATVGGILTGVEKRIKAFVLMGGGPKLTTWLRTLQDPRVARLREEGKLNAYLNLMSSIDADGYVSHAAPATILFQSGRYDENVTQERATQYHQAASDPKEVKWYDAGHSLNEEARRDHAEWLIRTLDVK